MGEQGLFMWGYWRKCWNALKTFKTIENTSNCYGKTMFINVGVLSEMLGSIENLSNQ